MRAKIRRQTIRHSEEAPQMNLAKQGRLTNQLSDHMPWELGFPVVGKGGGPVPEKLSEKIQEKCGTGRKLDPDLASNMEQTFSVRFEDVRIHADEDAGLLSHALGAKAFTIGTDIFFHNSADLADKSLLAHELTHVVQQSSSSTIGELEVAPSGDPLEEEADKISSEIATDLVHTVSGKPEEISMPLEGTNAPDLEFLTNPVQCSTSGQEKLEVSSTARAHNRATEQAAGGRWPVTKQNPVGSIAGVQREMLDGALEWGSNNAFGAILSAVPALAKGAPGAATTAGGILGMGLGPIAMYGGIDTIMSEFESGDANMSHVIEGGLGYTGGLVSGLAGVGTVASSGSAASGLASLGPAGALIGAGAGGFTLGTAIGENVIDPYLNRPKTEKWTDQDDQEAWDKHNQQQAALKRGEDPRTWQQRTNDWLDTW